MKVLRTSTHEWLVLAHGNGTVSLATSDMTSGRRLYEIGSRSIPSVPYCCQHHPITQLSVCTQADPDGS
jgi:hypothetical protein